jgi:hypothetical protein
MYIFHMYSNCLMKSPTEKKNTKNHSLSNFSELGFEDGLFFIRFVELKFVEFNAGPFWIDIYNILCDSV